jgi:hypothetical protein
MFFLFPLSLFSLKKSIFQISLFHLTLPSFPLYFSLCPHFNDITSGFFPPQFFSYDLGFSAPTRLFCFFFANLVLAVGESLL